MNLRNTPLRNTRHRLAALPVSLIVATRRLLAVLLIATLSPAAPLLAQAAASAPQSLHITILDGEDAINNIRERTAREPIVQVEDENHKPVAGALLLFTIQGGPNGAGASFNGLNTLSVTTDAEGKATAHGLVPNQTQGSYSIAVSATVGTLVATAIIKQVNSAAGAGGGGGNPSPVTPSSTTPTTGTTSATGTSGTSGATGASGTSGATGTSGTSGATGTTGTSGATGTTGGAGTTGTSTTTGTSSSAGGLGATSTSSPASTVGSVVKHGGRLGSVIKSPWIFGAVGAVVVTMAVRAAVITGKNPTSITPGTGTVGAP